MYIRCIHIYAFDVFKGATLSLACGPRALLSPTKHSIPLSPAEQCHAAVTCSTFDHYSRSVHKIDKLRVDPLLLASGFSFPVPSFEGIFFFFFFLPSMLSTLRSLLLPLDRWQLSRASVEILLQSRQKDPKTKIEEKTILFLARACACARVPFLSPVSTRIDSSARMHASRATRLPPLLACCLPAQWPAVSRIKGRLNGKKSSSSSSSSRGWYNLPE